MSAINGTVAVQRVRAGAFDIVFMDIQMPVMDGLEATALLRAELGEQLPIVALTANAFDEDRDRALEMGMNDFLTKPLSLKALIEVLGRFLQQSAVH